MIINYLSLIEVINKNWKKFSRRNLNDYYKYEEKKKKK